MTIEKISKVKNISLLIALITCLSTGPLMVFDCTLLATISMLILALSFIVGLIFYILEEIYILKH